MIKSDKNKKKQTNKHTRPNYNFIFKFINIIKGKNWICGFMCIYVYTWCNFCIKLDFNIAIKILYLNK